MSKLYDTYKNLKLSENGYVYLFKSGIFYILLDDDAKRVSISLGLKLTNFNDSILKCGFPISSKDKYFQLLKANNFDFKIIENTTIYTMNDYLASSDTKKLLTMISNVDTDTLSIKEAYEFIDKIKNIANDLSH